jgi:creatinine amidohydrolase
MKPILTSLILFLLGFTGMSSQTSNLSVHYEELASPEISDAINKSGGICIIPFGILEKHGPHLPLATDVYECREITKRAVEKEYCVVFPWYYFGQINEARHQPGVIAYSHEIIWNLLQETCSELARNGFKKILIMNGHGGNNDFLKYFCISQLEKSKDYIVVLFQTKSDSAYEAEIKKLSKSSLDSHAGEMETSMIYVIRPDLIRKGKAQTQSGIDQNLMTIPYQYTGIWWYSHFPNQYAGDGSKYSPELGNFILNHDANQLVELIRALKKDSTIEVLQKKFFGQSENPLKTKQD